MSSVAFADAKDPNIALREFDTMEEAMTFASSLIEFYKHGCSPEHLPLLIRIA